MKEEKRDKDKEEIYIELISLFSKSTKNQCNCDELDFLMNRINLISITGSIDVVKALNDYIDTWGKKDAEEQNNKYCYLLKVIRVDLGVDKIINNKFPRIGLRDINIKNKLEMQRHVRYNNTDRRCCLMEKTATLNLRVNPTVKARAESVLSKLGVPMSTAIDMYLNQISLTGGIPFTVTLPKAPDEINADLMTSEQLHAKLQKGYDDIEDGRVQNAANAFAKFRENHGA